jgi:hypothetical protein
MKRSSWHFGVERGRSKSENSEIAQKKKETPLKAGSTGLCTAFRGALSVKLLTTKDFFI